MNQDVVGAAEQGGPKRPAGNKFGRWLVRSVIVVCVAFLAIQLVPVNRSNPAVEADLRAPNEVNSILRRSVL